MKQFIAFVKKEFRHIFRDTQTIMILLIMPIAQIILFGFAVSTEVRNTEVAVFDPSKDISTDRIIKQFQASEYFTVIKMLDNPNEINEVLKEGKIRLVIVFGENFNDNLLHTGEASMQLIADATDPNQATTLTGYATRIIGDYQHELMRAYSVPVQINPQVRMLYNPQMKASYNFVPGVMGMILMLICAMMTSIAIVKERETGTMEILLASPMKPIYVIISKAVPYLVLSLVNLVTILLLSVFVLDVPVAGSLFLLGVMSFIFIMCALSLGLFISTLVNTQVAAMLASGMGLMMPVMMLSGMMFPIENMPAILQWLSCIFPARWYIAAVKKIMIEGLPVVSILKELCILSFMAAIFILVSLKKFKTRLE